LKIKRICSTKIILADAVINSAASGDSPQKHVYVRCMSMFVIIYVYMSFGFWFLGFMIMIFIHPPPYEIDISKNECQ
jgi:hypothetical protein